MGKAKDKMKLKRKMPSSKMKGFFDRIDGHACVTDDKELMKDFICYWDFDVHNVNMPQRMIEIVIIKYDIGVIIFGKISNDFPGIDVKKYQIVEITQQTMFGGYNEHLGIGTTRKFKTLDFNKELKEAIDELHNR